ncbi:ankyrin repeat domain-containing protein [Thauera sp. Sel9]|uniref:ankyrin repeat domain-containing protein n=1 Tax=Thauera sp. Sel9 TaxID=2974299 RepID=UPI0021E19BD6|nr:ankyrin repeat domain-containing protein [Thauera sp. Sel9]MCV2216092.1 ankyrin repeat domain-containing protein [Thauera sp. Sel9]
MTPSVWNVSTYYVDAYTFGKDDDGERIRRELKPVKAMREALAQGADPNERDALFTAIDKGSIGHVQALLKAGADHERVDSDGKSPLYRSVENRELDKVNALLKAGADVNAAIPSQVQQIHDDVPYTEIPDEPGQTAIMLAARLGHRPIFDRLKEAGASMDGVLHAAVIGEKEAAWRQDARQGSFSRSPMVEPLLAEGLDPNAACDAKFYLYERYGNSGVGQGGEGYTPLHLCVDSKLAYGVYGLDCAAALLKAGANPNAQDGAGETPLHMGENAQLAELLMTHGADHTLKNHDGQTPQDLVYDPAVQTLFRQHDLAKVATKARKELDLADPEELAERRGRFM